MTADVWFYSFYPSLATICCLLLCYKAWREGANKEYILLFSNLGIMNFFQALLYAFLPYHFFTAIYAADAYLIVTYFLFTHFMLLAFSLGEKAKPTWTQLLYIPPIILAVLHIAGFMVDHYRIEGHTLLHNDGPYAQAFDGFVLIASAVTITTFLTNARRIQNDYLLASRNLIAAISFIPTVVVAIILMILSNTDHTVSVVIVVPTLSIYIVSVFYYITRSQIIDLNIGPKALFARFKVAYLLLCQLNTKKDVDNFTRQLQVLKYKEAMQKHNNNFNAAADELKVHPTTLRNALKEQ